MIEGDAVIGVHVLDDAGKTIDGLAMTLDPIFLRRMLNDPEVGRLCCLRFIDPRGRTAYNHLQMGIFLLELDWLDKRATEQGEKQIVADLRRLAKATREMSGRHLTFTAVPEPKP